jgi:photosystem II stability/assembly factor-like uncharacterized protein
MKYILILILILSPLSFTQWFNASSGLPVWNEQGKAVDALNGSFAVISVFPPSPSECLYKTIDGGTSWTGMNLPLGILFSDISIADQNTLFGCDINSQKIFGTFNGGLTWQVLYDASQMSSFLNCVEMLDLNHGVAMGDAINGSSSVVFIKTTDGGQNWFSVISSITGGYSGNVWARIDFVSPEVGYFFDSNTQKLLKSVNGGLDWSVLDAFPSVSPMVIKFYDENIGLAVQTFSKKIFRTFNGGITWDTIYINSNSYGADVEFVPSNPSKIWFATFSELFFSDDAGATWQMDPISGSFENGRDLKITDEVGWFLCESVYKTENIYGISEVGDDNIMYPTIIELLQNYPNPFNPTTVIQYQIPDISFVQIIVYDPLGRQVAVLVNEEKPSGNYQVEFNASDLTSGVYFYQLKAGEFIQTKKMILLR